MIRLWMNSVHQLFTAKRVAEQQPNSLSGYPPRL